MKPRFYTLPVVILSILGILFSSSLVLVVPVTGESILISEDHVLSSPAHVYISSAGTPRSIQTTPDLVVESIVYSPSQPAIGQSVNITVTIKNQGSSAASGFYTHLYVNPVNQPPNADTQHTARTFWGIPLNPGASFQWVRTGHTFREAGVFPVYAWVDRDNAVAESDETNNLAGPINICVGGGCTEPDAYEPDDSCEQANQITTDGTEQLRNLYPVPDKDWVGFEAIGGVTYRIQAIADGADADLALELHSNCNTLPSFGSGADILFEAPSDGTYYIKVEHHELDYGPDTTYRLKVTTQNSCNGYYEPNNSCATAGHITPNQPAQLHSFCAPNDEDWVSFQTEAGATYTILATGIGASANVQLGMSATCADPPSSGNGGQMQYTAASAGTVFVRAINHNPQQFGGETEYNLQVIRQQSCVPDTFEIDDTSETAKIITANGSVQNRNFCPSGDEDWVRFEAVAGVEYTLETFNLGTATDTILCLYNANGTQQLVCDDDGGEWLGSRITWQAPTSGTYTARIINHDATTAGLATRYDLRLITGQCTPDAAEPDDSQATAQLINTNGSLYSRNTCPAGNEDWFAFNANSGSYVIETTNLGIESDTIIELYNSNGVRLAFNDDYGPGEASRIHYVFSDGGNYYLKVRQFNPVQQGIGTEYDVRINAGAPPSPTPSPTPPPTATPTPPPPSSDINTIILVNRERMVALYGEPTTAQLMTKLDNLAVHPRVNGEIIRLDTNQTVNLAYTAWIADYNNVDKANAVTAAIRGVIMSYLQQNGDVSYIVLVGDDRTIPFRRIVDNTPRNDYLERHYLLVDDSHPTGAAMRANHYLTDDYYADKEPSPFRGRELYIPDLAIGRLIETPAEIGAFIDIFLANPILPPSKVLVTGYDFVQDTATANCTDWKAIYGNANVDCDLIGDFWPIADFRTKQLNANPPFKIQSINGHADHFRQSAPGFGQNITGQEIAASSSDLAGGLVYTLGCHSGLNVPPINSHGPLDLAQAFAQKGSNYVGNTGYGWGIRGAIGLSEKLIRLYTEELQSNANVSMGEAFAIAKQRYYLEGQNLNGYDEKILQELIFYGLPMYSVTNNTPAFLSINPFPSVNLISGLPNNHFGSEAVISGTVSLNLIGALNAGDVMSIVTTDAGSYYELDGHTSTTADEPIQPLFFADVSVAGWPLRSIVIKSASYETLANFDPVIAAPMNDYMTQTVEAVLYEEGWYPLLPIGLQNHGDTSSLNVQLGQYNAENDQKRLYSSLDFDLYYSLSVDQEPPSISTITGLYKSDTNRINVKVGATDDSGVSRATIVYTDGEGEWRSLEMSFDADAYKWFGEFAGDVDTRYFVQIVDGVGNAVAMTNKGRYFSPVYLSDFSSSYTVSLPLILLGANP